jgi:hypothetical protein
VVEQLKRPASAVSRRVATAAIAAYKGNEEHCWPAVLKDGEAKLPPQISFT